MPATPLWLDQHAPAQWKLGSPVAEAQQAVASVNQQGSVFDTTVHMKVAGTIILGLVVIFGLQAMGFRFVTSASVGLGK